MPAVTADTLTLPRLSPLAPEASWRPVTRVVQARKFLEGEGFQVRRPFPGIDLSLADPFLLLDHMGAVEYGPGEAKGAPWRTALAHTGTTSTSSSRPLKSPAFRV